MPPVDQLRIEERKALLVLEKCLAHHHRALTGHRADAEVLGASEAADILQAAQWSLGVAIMDLARAQRLLGVPVDVCA